MKPTDNFRCIKHRLEKEHNVNLDHTPFTAKPLTVNESATVDMIYRESMTIQEANLSNGHILHLKIDESKIGVHESAGLETRKQITKEGNIVSQDISTVLNSSGFRPGMLPLRSMKMQWTLDEFMLMDSQFVYKVKAPEKGKGAVCKAANLDTSAIQNFQSYMENFDFKVMRIAYLYGTVAEDMSVKVEIVYEPPQETTDKDFEVFDDPKGDLVDGLVALLGFQKVGWIFAHPTREEGFYFSGPELMFTAEQQLEAAQGVNDTPFVTVTVSKDEQSQVVVEAFQVSKQCMEMVAEGVLGVSENLGSCMINPTFTVEVEGKAAKEVDNAFFLVSVPITQYDSEFLVSKFPRANRIDSMATRDDLHSQLQQVGREGWTMVQLLADFQLLLWLTDYLDIKTEISMICKSICDREIPLDEGYTLLLRSIAGM